MSWHIGKILLPNSRSHLGRIMRDSGEVLDKKENSKQEVLDTINNGATPEIGITVSS